MSFPAAGEALSAGERGGTADVGLFSHGRGGSDHLDRCPAQPVRCQIIPQGDMLAIPKKRRYNGPRRWLLNASLRAQGR